jgi:diguanylate cyclase (GGDEF)-like protein/PAS domain S-box-containing protein
MSERKSASSRHRMAKSSQNQRGQLLYPLLWHTEPSPESALEIQEHALAVVSHGVSIADATAQGFPLIYVNETFCAMTGYTPAEVLGKSCKFLQGPDTEADAVEVLRDALHTGTGCTVVLKNYRKDAFPFWNELSLTPVYDANGKVTHVVGVQHDVSRRVESELNLLQTKEDLERTTFEMAQVALELERANERHYYDAQHDPLTGLANRSLFNEHLTHVLERRKRQPELRFAVLYLDLDDFKQVNDTYGHEVGDALLVSVAQRLRACVRPSDTAARLGGDEFALLLEDLADLKEANAVAERVQSSLLESVVVGTHSLITSVSIGIATYPSATPEAPVELSASQVLRDADSAMYTIKKSRKT